MWSHLERYHPLEFATIKKTPTPDAAKAKDSSKETTPVSSGKRKKLDDQPRIYSSFENQTPFAYDSKQWTDITDKLTIMIAKLMLPFSLVDSTEFRDFVGSLNPRYRVPSREYISDTAIPKKYNQMKAIVMSDLQKANGISLTTDAWSSNTMDPYLSLTVHFITPSWTLQTYCLRTIYMPESHTGENLAVMIRNILREYEVTLDRVVSITTDSGRNMVKACDELTSLTRVPCFGHILHNAINFGTKDDKVESTLKSVRSVVTAFSHSGK